MGILSKLSGTKRKSNEELPAAAKAPIIVKQEPTDGGPFDNGHMRVSHNEMYITAGRLSNISISEFDTNRRSDRESAHNFFDFDNNPRASRDTFVTATLNNNGGQPVMPNFEEGNFGALFPEVGSQKAETSQGNAKATKAFKEEYSQIATDMQIVKGEAMDSFDHDDDDSTMGDYSESKRSAHVLSEKKRRNNLKNAFDELRDAVPCFRNHKGTRISKANVLRKAIEYIGLLIQEKVTLLRELKRTQQELSTVKMILKQYQQLAGPQYGMPQGGMGQVNPGMGFDPNMMQQMQQLQQHQLQQPQMGQQTFAPNMQASAPNMGQQTFAPNIQASAPNMGQQTFAPNIQAAAPNMGQQTFAPNIQAAAPNMERGAMNTGLSADMAMGDTELDKLRTLLAGGGDNSGSAFHAAQQTNLIQNAMRNQQKGNPVEGEISVTTTEKFSSVKDIIKFYVFCHLVDVVYESFSSNVSFETPEDFQSTVQTWFETSCSAEVMKRNLVKALQTLGGKFYTQESFDRLNQWTGAFSNYTEVLQTKMGYQDDGFVSQMGESLIAVAERFMAENKDQ